MIGQTITHYKILEKLGEGGMGVVYKAQDTKLDRQVALKFLPQQLVASEQDRARFVQEAKSAATLNHPSICTVHAIEDHEGQIFIVMEYVDGQTLKDRMANISPKHAIDIGIQVADGLAAAHEHGIVHRDIKPENIMVRKDGLVQIMDFGLAKPKGASRLTKEGSTVGTMGYMSPEQVQGFETDHRTDIYSLGVLLYEMLSGQSPYRGVHETAILYEIVNDDPPPMSSLKQEISPDLDAIVLECMAKEPSERYQSSAEVAKDLKRFKRESSKQRASRTIAARQFQKSAGVEVQHAEEQPKWKRFFWPALSGLLAIGVLIGAWNAWQPGKESRNSVMKFAVGLPEGASLDFGYGFSSVAISPDGKYFVYVSSAGGRQGLSLRAMDQFNAQALTGTEFSGDPFFSPDGQWVAFFAQGKLEKVSIFGGAPQEICETAGTLRGGWWAPDDFIYFGHINKGVQKVPASGGTPEIVTVLDSSAGEISHRFPQLLPDGKTVIFTVKSSNITSFDEAVIVAQRLDTGERKILIRGGTYGRFVPPGHLVYARNKSLFAAPFDADQLEIKGPPAPILDGGMLNQASGAANYSFSNTGILVYVPGGPIPVENNTLAWMDRRGRVVPLLEVRRSYFQGKLSPDGQKLALTLTAANDDIWVYHILRKTLTRLTIGGGNNNLPRWTPDGKRVVYSSEKGGSLKNIYWKPWDGSGIEERLTEGPEAQFPNSWSPDGKVLAFSQGGDIWVLSTENGRTPRPFLQSSFNEAGAEFSPDGRWMAYESDESGRSEIYVVPFPKSGAKYPISNGGGDMPMWSQDGKELFYLSGDSVMVVGVSSQPAFSASAPRKLLELPQNFFMIDVTPDGQRFAIIVSSVQGLTTTQVNVVNGWFDELKEKVSANR